MKQGFRVYQTFRFHFLTRRFFPINRARTFYSPMGDSSAFSLSDLTSTTSSNSLPLVSVPKHRFSDRVLINSILARADGGLGLAGQRVRVGGWVKTGREQGKGSFAFLEVNDGSCSANLQVIVDASVTSLSVLVPTGTCVSVEGVLKVPPEGTKQKVELRVEQVLHVGSVDPAKYPIPKTKLTLEFLRDIIHLRSKTNTFSAIARIRNALTFCTHCFFQENNFLHIHTPVITTSDCEGAGEMFQVTTLINEIEKIEKDLIENPPPSEADVEAARSLVKTRGEAVAELKSCKGGKEEIASSVAELVKAKEHLSKLEARRKVKPGVPKKGGKLDYTLDFFGRQAFLTVSGQLQIETFACAVSNVYTFGPTFRAEHSHTSRHLAEFWMVEPEMAFAELGDVMDCAEAYVKYMCQWLIDKCPEDMQLMAKLYDKGCIDRLALVVSSPFERVTYTEAIRLLEDAVEAGKKFENKVEWGIDLASEHERYLTEVKFQKPVIVYNYPKHIKAFYMRLNDDSKTVAAMDILVPKVGELIGGSQREERYDMLRRRIIDMGLPLAPYEWYLDLRRYGTVKHGGFGLGFERMMLFATGIDNIRDVIPFPRYPGRADL